MGAWAALLAFNRGWGLDWFTRRARCRGFYMYIIIKRGFDIHTTKKFGDTFISSRFFVLTSVPLWMDWRVTDANRAAKGPWCPWVPKKWFTLHAILFCFQPNMTQKILSSMPLHGPPRKNVICFAIRYIFLILAQIDYIWTTQIKYIFYPSFGQHHHVMSSYLVWSLLTGKHLVFVSKCTELSMWI